MGDPRVLISHGVNDPVLPNDRTSRRIVPALEHAGYDLTYLEFNGGHTIPPDIALQAAVWLGWKDLSTG